MASRGMPFSHKWSKTLALDGRLSSSDLAVLRALALHMAANGGTCRPTHALVAHETHFAERTVRQAVERGRRFGWLVETVSSAPGRAAEYVARIPEIPVDDRLPPPVRRHHDAAVHRHEGAAVEGERRQFTSRTPAPRCLPGSHEVSNADRRKTGRRPDPIFDALASEWGIERDEDGVDDHEKSRSAINRIRALS